MLLLGCCIAAQAAIVPPQSTPGLHLQQLVDAAIATAAQTLDVTEPVYDFDGAKSLQVYGAESLSITAAKAGTTLYFKCGDGVHIANSSNVRFSGFTISYRRPCFAQGMVVRSPSATDSNGAPSPLQSVDIEFDTTNFPSPEEVLALAGSVKSDAGKIKVTFFSNESLRIIAHGNHLYSNMTSMGSATSRVWYKGAVTPVDAVQPGALVTLHPRLGIANGTGVAAGLTYLVTNCSSVVTTDLTVHGGATESIVEGGGEGNNTYIRNRVVRDPQQTNPVRLLAANADGFHSSCVKIGPKLMDSELSFTGDDLLNIHSRMSLVLQPLSPTAAYVIDALGSSSPADCDPSTLMLQQTVVGDTLAFWTLGSLAANGSSTVTALSRVPDSNAEVHRAAVNALAEINEPPYSQQIGHPFGTRVWLVNWSAPLARLAPTGHDSPRSSSSLVPKFALVDVPRLRPHGAVVSGCHFHDSYMR
jgi:hypothetical protein